MKTKIFCKTTEKDIQSFYVKVNGKEYYLFNQKYRRSVKKFFLNGISIDEINNYANVKSHAVKRTLDKLPSYIRYIENEYNVAIYEKSKKQKNKKKNEPYKREPFRWQTYIWEVA